MIRTAGRRALWSCTLTMQEECSAVCGKAGCLTRTPALENHKFGGRGLLPRPDDELAVHLATAVFGEEVAVEGKRSGLVRPELEGDGASRPDALRDPVVVDRDAVRDVLGPELDRDEIVLKDFDARGLETVSLRG